jgi:hypothetical protein
VINTDAQIKRGHIIKPIYTTSINKHAIAEFQSLLSWEQSDDVFGANNVSTMFNNFLNTSGVPKGGCSNPPSPKCRGFDKAGPKYVVLTYQELRKFYYME